ncbi:hypothetical protein C8R46DRAFT_1233522 [Mycena filopes]|nr:hypothetical protein C8R46DRAFT_1233522 [Mycena filopes]
MSIPPRLRALVDRLGSDIDAWLANATTLKPLPHLPPIFGDNSVTATYMVPAGTHFLVCWRVRTPIVALCAITRPPLPGQTTNCRASLQVLDNRDSAAIPTQQWPWGEGVHAGPDPFASPPVSERGFVALEVHKAVRCEGIGLGGPFEPSLYVADPREEGPPLELRFNLVGVAPPAAIEDAPPVAIEEIPAAAFLRSRAPSPVVPQLSSSTQRQPKTKTPAPSAARTPPPLDLAPSPTLSTADLFSAQDDLETVVDLLLYAIATPDDQVLALECQRRLIDYFGGETERSK